jgi:hypothetical protein
MPSQAEVIQALRNAGLSQVPPPQSPASVTAGAAPFASALGLPEALQALRGQLTPEEAKGFALTSAMGLLPGAKTETAAVKTMGELLPHFYPEGSTFANMTPKGYLTAMGSSLPEKLPQDVENVLKPYMQPPKTGRVPGPVKIYNPQGSLEDKKDFVTQQLAEMWHNGENLPGATTNSKFDIENNILPKLGIAKHEFWGAVEDMSDKIDAIKQAAANPGKMLPPGITQTDIDKELAKNPGASIFDIAKTNIEGPSTQYSPAPLTNSMLGTKGYGSANESTIPREGGIQYTPLKASILGTSENLLHGTRMGDYAWKTPTGGLMGTEADALRLPDDELGVHFGNPKQAQVFASSYLDEGYKPRYYPVVVATNNPLRMQDLGSWGTDNLDTSLRNLNRGRFGGKYKANISGGTDIQRNLDSPETVGKFPDEEVDKLHGIQDYRDYIASKGYDSVVYKNTEEDPGHDSYIKFTPSPEAPDFVTGVRSPFAAFDPAKIMRPELAAGIGGAAALSPQGQEYIQALQNGGQQNQ